MFKRSICLAALAATSCFCFAQVVGADELYRINLTPPAHVGDKLIYNAVENESVISVLHQTVAPIPGMPALPNDGILAPDVKNSHSGVVLDAVVDIKACDGKSRPSQMDFTVYMLAPYLNPADLLIAPGCVIRARRVRLQDSPESTVDSFTWKDAPLEPLQDQAIRRLVTIGSEHDLTEQEAFGPKTPLPIGGTWSLDGQVGAGIFARMKIAVDPKHVTGTGKLLSKTSVNGADRLHVAVHVTCDNYAPPLAAKLKLDRCTLSGALTYDIAASTGQVIRAQYMAHLNYEVAGKNERGPFAQEFSFDTSRSIEIRPYASK